MPLPPSKRTAAGETLMPELDWDTISFLVMLLALAVLIVVLGFSLPPDD